MNFPLLSKLQFYLILIYYKLTSWTDCRNYRLKIFLNEFVFLIGGLTKFKILPSDNRKKIILKTYIGDYKIRDTPGDLNIVSPAFERPDVNELFRIIEQSLQNENHVIFIDAGACFGKFTVAVGKQFKRYAKQVSILSFEPDPENFQLLKDNIHLNRLTNVKAFHTALSAKKGKNIFYYFRPLRQIVSFPTSEKIVIQTTPLDAYIPYLPKDKNTTIIMKLDVEGHETEVLKGSKKIFKTAKEVTLMIEDSMYFTSNSLMNYLNSYATFFTKKTSYNSFWKLFSKNKNIL